MMDLPKLLGMDQAEWDEVVALTMRTMDQFARAAADVMMDELEAAWVADGVKPDWMHEDDWTAMQARVEARKPL